jgi:GTPase SAR1 family protein
MTSLAEHHSSHIVKLLYIGDSGTGKTGSLTSLVKGGYNSAFLTATTALMFLFSS